jgi:4-hydroxy 2-oxovalerate aldolase
MESYGADGVIIMDSAGAYIPSDVTEKISAIVNRINIPVGFHAHNNLGLSIANSIAAIESGALILDGTIKGFGAGAGNAQLEVLVAVLHKMGYTTGIDLYGVLDAADIADRELVKVAPTIKSISIVSGLSGVFSAFSVHVDRVSKEFGVNPRDVFFELGKRKIVAGQEDMIVEVAIELSKGKRQNDR